MTELSERGRMFRAAIAAFIDARRDAKLKGTEEEGEAASKYEYTTWLADAARRVSQIQAVTHALKATHPDARGSSLHFAPATLPQHAEIGTHNLGGDYAEDVVGNAAALDVFKFLKLEVDGRRLLHWMQADDADLLHALHENDTIAVGWMQAFSHLVRTDSQPASHEAAKQIYWLTGDSAADDCQFHLLQPLTSSSLAHAVHIEVQDARFGETNKLARKAFREELPLQTAYRNYRDLAVRKLGGTKPQNISQLNSERGGVNYLLSSLPPRWKQPNARRLNDSDSLWKQFLYFGSSDGERKTEVKTLLKALTELLKSNPTPNLETRQTRIAFEQELGLQLTIFAAAAQTRLEPGWSREADCVLALPEKLWLDPIRLELPNRTESEQHTLDDEAFKSAYEQGDWPDQVAKRFGNWLNAELRKGGLNTVGATESEHWAKQAIVDAAWPVPRQRRMSTEATA